MDHERDFEDGFVRTSLGMVHYRHHAGNGHRMIFLHGLGATMRVWSRLVTFLPDDFDVYLIDLLGHGKSDAPRIDYTIAVQAQVLREFLEGTGGSDSYVFGHSYGGWIAAHYASQRNACRGVILEDAAGLKESFDGRPDEHRSDLIRAAMAINNNKEYVIRSIVESDYYRNQLTVETLARIDRPAMIVWGSEDKTIDRAFADVFAERIKKSRLEIISGAGHYPHYTHPKEVSEILIDFTTR